MRIFLLLILLKFSLGADAQVKSIAGRVIDANLIPIREARIIISDTLVAALTDSTGSFTVDIPVEEKKMKIAWIGFEWAYIHLDSNCNNIEVILQESSTYDFMTLREVDKRRLKEFKKLPTIHLQAYKTGLFTTDHPCYSREFVPHATKNRKP